MEILRTYLEPGENYITWSFGICNFHQTTLWRPDWEVQNQ